jgi:uncharacterized membrane protein
MESPMILFTILLIVLLILPGILLAITPWLVRDSECFTVTIPKSAVDDPRLKRFRRNYAVWMGIATGLFAVIACICSVISMSFVAMIILSVSPLVLCALSFGLMLWYRARVRAIKIADDWTEPVSETAVAVVSTDLPSIPSLKWDLLYLIVIALTLIIGYLGYGLMPERIPMHAGFDGTINGWADRTPLVILIPVLIQAFLALCLTLAHWMILRSKRALDPDAPQSSALAYALFARAQAWYLIGSGLFLCIMMIAFPLAMMQLITLMEAGVLVLVGAVILIVGDLVIALMYGQSGARVIPHQGKANTTITTDDDRFWKAGIFYFNPGDPSIFVPKRFGIGWTGNFARPGIWLFLIGIIALAILLITGISALQG